MIDLHSHTTASDGQFAPAELLLRAARAGVTRLAITDHDTVDGVEEATQTGQKLGVEVIAGIELSARLGHHEVHILGHFLDTSCPSLREHCVTFRRERRERMARMVEQLNARSIPIRMEDVLERARGANLGRPHLARLLVERGWCTDMQDAFSRYLGQGRPGYVDSQRLDAAGAIQLIHAAGGTATLAHPLSSKMDRHHIARLRAAGMDGLEVFHPDHPRHSHARWLRISRELDLIPTSGSDFHGESVAPRHELGDADMLPARLEALRSRAAAWRSRLASV
ncbi:MAG: PHP domain-containing protein [Myxococcota bacterium]